MALDFGSAVGGGLSGLYNLYAADRLPGYKGYVPNYTGQTDQRFQDAMSAIVQATDRNTGLVDPILLESFSSMLGIDLSGIVQAGQKAGGEYAELGDLAAGGAGTMFDQSGKMFGAGQDIYEMGRDPRGTQHDFMRHGAVEDARAADSARGIAMSPLSSGHESDAVRNFEMDWQNQQLGRASQGLQGMQTSGYYGGLDLGRGMDMAGMQPGFTIASATTPVQSQQSVYQMPMDWASNFSQAEGANVISPYYGIAQGGMPYLGMSGQIGENYSNYDFNSAITKNNMITTGIGQMTTGYDGKSGMGNPANWYTPNAGGGAGPG